MQRTFCILKGMLLFSSVIKLYFTFTRVTASQDVFQNCFHLDRCLTDRCFHLALRFCKHEQLDHG